MATKACPECKSNVALDARHCPNCPHSFLGEEDGIQRKRHGKNSATPLALALFVGALIYGAWFALSFVIRYGNSDAEAPRSASKPKLRGAAAPFRSAYRNEREEDSPIDRVIISQAPRNAREAAAAPWRLRGVVYDLVTLRPVPYATMLFKDAASNRRFETMTDAGGRYRVEIPPLHRRGYSVVLIHSAYAPSSLSPGAGGLIDSSEAVRREMARDLSHALDAPYTLEAYGSEPVLTNFYLAPLKLKAN